MDPKILSEFMPITLKEKPLFDEYFKRYNYPISEYTFTNLYMWRNYYQIRWKVIDDSLFIISLRDSKELGAFPPLGNDPEKGVKILENLAKSANVPLRMYRVHESFISKLNNFRENLNIEEDRPNCDYIYLKDNLINLPGKEYLNIRKKLNKFKKRYNWTYHSLDEGLISLILDMQEEWCGVRDCEDDESLASEYVGIRDILENWIDLGLIGGAIKVDNKVIAYTIGEVLTQDTVVIHVEKANPDYLGAYQAINQFFVNSINSDIVFINREQDLGNENLRKSKERYHPEHFIKKYNINDLVTN